MVQSEPEGVMPSEASRGLVRIVSNYARLGLSLVIGIALAPIQLAWLGENAFGLLMLLGSSVGLASMVLEIIDRSMIRELGAAFHGQDEARFQRIYNSSFALSALAALVFFAGWMAVLLLLPYFSIPPELLGPARWLTIAEGLYLLVLVLFSPCINMYVVAERFVLFNTFHVLMRTSYLIPALVLYFGMGMKDDPARALTLYAIWCTVLNVSSVLLPVVLLVATDRRMLPRPWRGDRASVREVFGTLSWNSAVVLAISSHDRVCTVIGNLALPVDRALRWNAAFGLAVRAVGYVRQATVGMTIGLDSVSARLSSGEDQATRLRHLAHQSTRLHALVALPAGLTMLALAEPVLWLWVGRAVQNPEVTIPRAVPMVQLLVFGMTARSISDSWIYILYGAGQIRRVAPLILAGGLLTPIVAILLLWALPDPAREKGPAIAFAASLVAINLLALPPLAARSLGLRTRDLLWPLARPAMAAGLALPVYVGAWLWVPRWSLLELAAVPLTYGALYGVLAYAIVLRRDERARLLDLGLRLLGRRRAPAEPAHPPPAEELEGTASPTSTGL